MARELKIFAETMGLAYGKCFYNNKSKEKSMVNFLGVMFMMVYVALFTSILALNISKNILDAFNTGVFFKCRNDLCATFGDFYTDLS